MADEQFEQQPEETTPRLTFLRILCITSFIGSGLGFISYLFCGIFFDSLGPAVKTSAFVMQRDLMLMLMAAGQWFFLINALLFGLSLYGAIHMWKLHKIGFHFYAMSQIALLIVPLLFMRGYAETLPQAMLTGIFIFSYASHLRFMK
jgi:hypothetical protein